MKKEKVIIHAVYLIRESKTSEPNQTASSVMGLSVATTKMQSPHVRDILTPSHWPNADAV